MLFRNDKKDNRDASANEQVLVAAAAGTDRFPPRSLSNLCRPPEVDQGAGSGRGAKKPILLAAQKDARVSDPGPDDIYPVGTLGVVVQLLRLPDGTVKALLEGKSARAHRALRQRGRILPGRSRGDRGGLRAHHRGRGADAFGQRDLRQLRPPEQEDSARDGDLDRGGRRSRLPGRQAGRPSGDQARRQAVAARMHQSGRTAGAHPRLHALRARKSWKSKSASAPGSRSRWRRPRRSTTSTSRCGRSRRNSARRTNSKTRARSSRTRCARRRCRPRRARSASARSRSSR